MKKIISIILAIVMMMAIAIPTFAAEKTLDQDHTSNTATAYYQAGKVVDDNNTEDPTDDTVQGTWSVTIPTYINVAKKDSVPTEYSVVAKDVLIPYDTNLTVAVDYDALELSGNTLAYKMQADPQSSNGTLADITTGATILTAAAGNPTAVTTSQIGAVLTAKPVYSGIWTDTVTFTVTVA
ncbi:MAG: hypothetical protein K2G60_06170 [Oscillospiraceae bacterium]|nr:hypothetical protein [Oscillospiraceae bacterium]